MSKNIGNRENELKDLELEKDVIYGLLKHPDIFLENQSIIKEDCFTHPTHKIIFNIFKNNSLSANSVDIVTLARSCKKDGFQDKDGIPIFEYLENSQYSSITSSGTIECIKELHILAYLRHEFRKSKEIAKLALDSKNTKDVLSVVSEIDTLKSERYELQESQFTPRKIYDGITSRIEERGNNPEDIIGYETPFSEFNMDYGGLRTGTATLFVGRGGIGKSSTVHQICYHIAKKNKIPVLIVDTEMEYELVSDRVFSSQNQVPIHAVESGKWRNNKDIAKKVRSALDDIDEEFEYYHVYVGDQTLQESMQIIETWYYKHVGRGNPCVVGYDYLNCNAEDIKHGWGERQVLGDKFKKLRHCCVKINALLITAAQANRSAESRNRRADQVSDDTTVIGDSDKLQRFAETVLYIRPKTPDELALDEGMDLEEAEDAIEDRDFEDLRFGTHKMFVLKGRNQGERAMGHNNTLRRRMPNGIFQNEMHYYNISFDNFFLTERGSLRDVINFREDRFILDDAHPNEEDSEELL